jgi:aminomethyltransferase
VRCVSLIDKGIARAGAPVFHDGEPAGFVTSGTMVPFWAFEGQGVHAEVSDITQRRSICLAYLDSDIIDEEPLTVDIRGKQVAAMACAVPRAQRGTALHAAHHL